MLTIRPSLLGILLAATAAPLAALSISQFNTAALENFDTLGSATDSVVPAGWQFTEVGSGANTTYGAGSGGSSTGNTYSFGATSSTDRAFGSLRTSSVASTIGTVVTNDTGSTITQLTIEFTGEQWRLGALSRVDRMDFGYSTDAGSIGTGTWIDVNELDFVGVVTSGVTGALDGNASENRLLVTHTITGLNLLSGGTLWLRWSDFDASGSDDGLSIDNFAITALQTIGGGGAQNVPDSLPIAAVILVLGGLLVLGSMRRPGAAA
jgi:hypothetical protein